MNELGDLYLIKAALLDWRLADVNVADGFPKGRRVTVDGLEIGLPLANILDLNAEAG